MLILRRGSGGPAAACPVLSVGLARITATGAAQPARRDRVLEAAEYIAVDRLGTCDDCGFSPFGDDLSTPRETAFAKIRARVEGTRLASAELGL